MLSPGRISIAVAAATGSLAVESIAAQESPIPFVAHSVDARILPVAEVRGIYLVRPDRVLVLVTEATLQAATEEPIPIDAVLTALRAVGDRPSPGYMPPQVAVTLVDWEASPEVRTLSDTLAITLRFLRQPVTPHVLLFRLLFDERRVLAELRVPELVEFGRE